MLPLKIFLIVLPIFLVIDLVWLGVIMKGFYSEALGDLARRSGASISPRWGAALVVYLMIPLGILLFVRPYVGPTTPVWQAFAWGALYGLVLYGVFDLTNLATLEKWTLKITLADMAWGTVLSGTMSVVMKYVEGWLRG